MTTLPSRMYRVAAKGFISRRGVQAEAVGAFQIKVCRSSG
jgi:hypothetical protein